MSDMDRTTRGKMILIAAMCVILVVLVFLCADMFRKESIPAKENPQAESHPMSDALSVSMESAAPETEPATLPAATSAPTVTPTTAPTAAPATEAPTPQPLMSLDGIAAGTVIDASRLGADLSLYFRSYGITEGDAVFQRIIGKSYRPNNDISLSDLRYLKVLHYNFNHQIQVGEMIVNQAISDDTLNVFRDLFSIRYEIQSMYLVDNYWAGDGESTDTASIEENNTSAFNYRSVTGGGRLSNHALGRAIDINPQQNPYVKYRDGVAHWAHQNANAYIDRNSGLPHVIVEGDECQSIFARYGFSWGGNWGNPVDYQHFEKTDE